MTNTDLTPERIEEMKALLATSVRLPDNSIDIDAPYNLDLVLGAVRDLPDLLAHYNPTGEETEAERDALKAELEGLRSVHLTETRKAIVASYHAESNAQSLAVQDALLARIAELEAALRPIDVKELRERAGGGFHYSAVGLLSAVNDVLRRRLAASALKEPKT